MIVIAGLLILVLLLAALAVQEFFSGVANVKLLIKIFIFLRTKLGYYCDVGGVIN